MLYRYDLLLPTPIPGSANAHGRRLKVNAHNEVLLDADTLGIEVSEPDLAARCGLGNIDPQHGQNATPEQAAIEAALIWSDLPPPGSRLVTIRVDLDALGAMALLTLRASDVKITDSIKSRVGVIGEQDRFAKGAWPGPRPLPATGQEFIGATNAEGPLAPLNALMAAREIKLDAKVAAVGDWLRDGHFVGEERYRQQALVFAARMETAVLNGDFNSEVLADGHIALLETTAVGALSVIGYRLAPVVIALNPQHRFLDDTTGCKVTVAQYREGHVDLVATVTALQALEAGWGGGRTIIGSPQGSPSTLSLKVISSVVKKHLCNVEESDQSNAEGRQRS